MKDAQLADLIKSIVRVSRPRYSPDKLEPECTSKINPPFVQSHHTQHRMFDKAYSLDGLTVFVETELGKRKRKPSESYVGSDRHIVTVAEQRAYARQEESARERLLRRAKEGVAIKIDFNTPPNYIEGPVVDNAKDTELTTAKVHSVLAQYDGLNLTDFAAAPEWKRFAEMVAKKYCVDIKPSSDGTLKRDEREQWGMLTLPGATPKQRVLVYQQHVTSEDQFERRISEVYCAGSTLQRALKDRIDDLAEKYLKPFAPFSS